MMAVNKLKLNKDKTEQHLLHSRFSSPPQLHLLTFGNDTVYFAAHVLLIIHFLMKSRLII